MKDFIVVADESVRVKSLKKAQTVLKEAKKIFVSKKLNKGSYGPNINQGFASLEANERINLVEEADKICLSAAIYGLGYDPSLTKAAFAVFAKANKLEKITDIPIWNDRKSRTKKDVLNAFDKAIRFKINLKELDERNV